MKICRNLTLNEFSERLRSVGFSIGTEKLKAAINAGYFGCNIAAIPMSQSEFIIPERAVNDWIDANCIETEPSSEVLRAAAAIKSATA